MERKKVAVYGGSFNPPTMSHFEIMRMIIDDIKIDDKSLDELWVVPCGDRRDKKISTPGEKRLEMCKIGIKEFFGDDPRIKVDPIEINNGTTIPTYFLINLFEEMYQEYDFYFVMGSDLLPSFKFWHRGEHMYSEFKFILIPREGFEELDDSLYPKNYIECPKKVKDAFSTSSTEIRDILHWSNIIHHATFLKEKLGKDIYDFILENNLYA